MDARNFKVSEVDGRKVDHWIVVSGIEDWPAGKDVTLSGIEVGTLFHVYKGMTNFANHDSRYYGPYQVLDLRFDVSEVVAPANLHVADTPDDMSLPPEDYMRDEK